MMIISIMRLFRWAAVAGLGAIFIACVIWQPTAFYVPKQQRESSWLFKVLALWGERMANVAWHRGGEPEDLPAGFLNRMKYHADWGMARAAARQHALANYQLASTWYRFSLALNQQDVGNWRLAAFLASLSGDMGKTRRYLASALDAFPNHPLILLEKSTILGRYEHPRIHRMWAEQALNAFRYSKDKSIYSMLDLRMFFLECIAAVWRGDRNFQEPRNRRTIIQLYEELAQYEPIALERSFLYKKMLELEKGAPSAPGENEKESNIRIQYP